MAASDPIPAETSPGLTQGGAGAIAEYDIVSFAGRVIDFGNLSCESRATPSDLTVMEAELLRHLIRNQGRAVSRKSILEEVWGLHEDTDTRAIDNFVVRLRRYIEEDPARHVIS